jgi:hypothetical protein
VDELSFILEGVGFEAEARRLWLGMKDKHPDPVVVGEYPTEFEASLVKNMLSMEGVPSELVGAMTAGFRAETPGMVKVLVPGSFAELAREIVAAQEAGGLDDEELRGEDS